MPSLLLREDQNIRHLTEMVTGCPPAVGVGARTVGLLRPSANNSWGSRVYRRWLAAARGGRTVSARQALTERLMNVAGGAR